MNRYFFPNTALLRSSRSALTTARLTAAVVFSRNSGPTSPSDVANGLYVALLSRYESLLSRYAFAFELGREEVRQEEADFQQELLLLDASEGGALGPKDLTYSDDTKLLKQQFLFGRGPQMRGVHGTLNPSLWKYYHRHGTVQLIIY